MGLTAKFVLVLKRPMNETSPPQKAAAFRAFFTSRPRPSNEHTDHRLHPLAKCLADHIFPRLPFHDQLPLEVTGVAYPFFSWLNFIDSFNCGNRSDEMALLVILVDATKSKCPDRWKFESTGRLISRSLGPIGPKPIISDKLEIRPVIYFIRLRCQISSFTHLFRRSWLGIDQQSKQNVG